MDTDHPVGKATDFELEKLFNSITDIISVHDRNFRIVRANKSFFSFIGKSQEDLLGKHCYEVFHGKSEPWPNCPYKKSLEFNSTVSEVIEDDNLPVPLLVSCCPIYDETDQIVAVVHIARNISRERHRERKREELIRELSEALTELKVLNGILTICVSCKNIKEGDGAWVRIEKFIAENTKATFSHGICPDCAQKLYPDLDDE